MTADLHLHSIAEPYSRYLRILGFDAVPSGIEGLRAIVHRHLVRVPFENVSKLLLFGREGAGRVISLSEFLDGIDNRDLGGTCYSSNPFLAQLLRALGYDADLLGADMKLPNVHTAIRVRIEGVSYHVDAGYAAPLLWPIRLDQSPFEVPHGRYRYVLEDNSSGGCRITVWHGRECVHGYAVHGPARSLDFFRPIILDSYTPGRMFMSCLRITRCFGGHTFELRNSTLTCYRGAEADETRLCSMQELRQELDYRLAMPRCPIEEAVSILEKLTGRDFFDNHAVPQF